MARIMLVPLLVAASSSLVTLAEDPGGDLEQESAFAPKYPKKYVGKVRAELLLDEATGFLTYQLRCISDEPVKIHLESLEGIGLEVMFKIAPVVDHPKASTDFDDDIHPDANVTLPYGVKAKMVGVGTPAWKELMKEREREKALDRVVELKKNEAVSRSFYIYDAPWFDNLVKTIEKKKFKAYRVDPRAFVVTADSDGKPVTDHQIEIWNYENAHAGKFNVVYFTGGLILDLAKVKKIQALRPTKKKNEKEEE